MVAQNCNVRVAQRDNPNCFYSFSVPKVEQVGVAAFSLEVVQFHTCRVICSSAFTVEYCTICDSVEYCTNCDSNGAVARQIQLLFGRLLMDRLQMSSATLFCVKLLEAILVRLMTKKVTHCCRVHSRNQAAMNCKYTPIHLESGVMHLCFLSSCGTANLEPVVSD